MGWRGGGLQGGQRAEEAATRPDPRHHHRTICRGAARNTGRLDNNRNIHAMLLVLQEADDTVAHVHTRQVQFEMQRECCLPKTLHACNTISMGP